MRLIMTEILIMNLGGFLIRIRTHIGAPNAKTGH